MHVSNIHQKSTFHLTVNFFSDLCTKYSQVSSYEIVIESEYHFLNGKCVKQGSASNLGHGPVFFLATRWRARVWVAAYLDAAIGAPYVTSQQLGLHGDWIGLLKITNDNKPCE